MGALDSSLVFFLPLGIDFAVIILAARKPDLFWLYALLATVGSVHRRHGHVLDRPQGRRARADPADEAVAARTRQAPRIPSRRLRRRGARRSFRRRFPFTAFVLASGAFGGQPWTFFTTLAGVRVVRFLAEGGLAAIYGRRILTWMQSTVFEVIVGALIVLAIVGTIVSGVAVVPQHAQRARRSERRSGRRTPALRSDREPQHRGDAAVVGQQLRHPR